MTYNPDPAWTQILRKLRSAMKRGRTSEQAITRYAQLDPWETRAGLEMLAQLGEVEMIRDARWRGLAKSTRRYPQRNTAPAAKRD